MEFKNGPDIKDINDVPRLKTLLENSVAYWIPNVEYAWGLGNDGSFEYVADTAIQIGTSFADTGLQIIQFKVNR
ncbi:MAG: hypothetical protein A2487_11515 [Candidatus Raymondbacteria bacterium RifOxyC12_full_50_8]|nr:MAG: hypothetical protein A2487_11515 [Candidatus Raymondbacteria bacterium RifOxyC12_full_50_8]OGK02732.1 MAG: hypothetical protein A2350_07170 [Candidatus Raymondbacteria bacterium RifOxyB12_full_50_8]